MCRIENIKSIFPSVSLLPVIHTDKRNCKKRKQLKQIPYYKHGGTDAVFRNSVFAERIHENSRNNCHISVFAFQKIARQASRRRHCSRNNNSPFSVYGIRAVYFSYHRSHCQTDCQCKYHILSGRIPHRPVKKQIKRNLRYKSQYGKSSDVSEYVSRMQKSLNQHKKHYGKCYAPHRSHGIINDPEEQLLRLKISQKNQSDMIRQHTQNSHRLQGICAYSSVFYNFRHLPLLIRVPICNMDIFWHPPIFPLCNTGRFYFLLKVSIP